MPKTHTTSTRRTTYRRSARNRIARIRYGNTARTVIIIIAAGLAIGVLLSCILANVLPRRLFTQYPSGPYTVVGKPTISADFINQVLERNHSPANGKGQALYDYGVKYNIDPAFALAFFMHESGFGTQGVARVTHSLGNIRASDGYTSYEGYRRYKTWEEGFEDWYKLISQQYVDQWSLYTVDQIIPVYAPSSDNNDEGAYIQAVKDAVDTWRSGVIST